MLDQDLKTVAGCRADMFLLKTSISSVFSPNMDIGIVV